MSETAAVPAVAQAVETPTVAVTPGAVTTGALVPPPVAVAVAPAVPETLLKGEPEAAKELELTFKEGSEPDKDLVDQFLPMAKELKLSKEAAQKLYDLYVSAQDKVGTAHTERVVGWAKESREDKDFGGANFDTNLAVANKALGRLGTPALRELLQATGLGNHPEIIRAFYQAGKVLPEDRLPGGSSKQDGASDKEAQLRALFPNSPGMFSKT